MNARTRAVNALSWITNRAGNSFASHCGNTRTSLPERRSSRMTHSDIMAIPRPERTASRRLVTPSDISTGEIRNVCSPLLAEYSVTSLPTPNRADRLIHGHDSRSDTFLGGERLLRNADDAT